MWRWLPILVLVSANPRSAAAGPLSLGLAWEWRQTNSGASTSGVVYLTVPLERLARPARPFAPSMSLAEPPETPPDDAEPTRIPAAPAVKRAAPRAALVDPAFARRLVRAALRVRGDWGAGERLDGLSLRSRVSAALPELTLRAVRSTDESLRLSPSGTYVNDYTQTGGAGLLLEARATWKLDRLVFADEELQVERLRAQRGRLTERVIAAVLKELTNWQRARLRLLDSELTPEEQLSLEVQLLTAESALDVLTDGLFSGARKAEEEAGSTRGRAARPPPSQASPTP